MMALRPAISIDRLRKDGRALSYGRHAAIRRVKWAVAAEAHCAKISSRQAAKSHSRVPILEVQEPESELAKPRRKG